MAGPLCGPLRSGRHHQRARSRTRHAPLPLPGTAESPPTARVHSHRRKRRAPQPTAADRRSTPVAAADRLPELPGPARDPPAEVLAVRQRLSRRHQDPRQSQRPGPSGVQEHPRSHPLPGPCSQTHRHRPRSTTRRQEQTPGTPLRRRQDRQTRRDPRRTPRVSKIKNKLSSRRCSSGSRRAIARSLRRRGLGRLRRGCCRSG